MLLSRWKVTEADGLTVLELAPSLSDAWIGVCRKNKKIHELTDKYLAESVWLPVIALGGMLISAVAENHGLIKKQKKDETPIPGESLSEEQRAMLYVQAMMARKQEREVMLSGIEGD